MKMTITARPLCHRGENRIKIELSDKDWAAIGKIKSIPGRKWSRTHRCWHVPFTEDALRQLKGCFGDGYPYKTGQVRSSVVRSSKAGQAAAIQWSPIVSGLKRVALETNWMPVNWRAFLAK